MDLGNWLSGVPFGASIGWIEITGGLYEVGSSPHNLFVLTLVKMGIFGLLLGTA
jgi:hypothetical protein